MNTETKVHEHNMAMNADRKWIPVNERLPEVEGEYFVTVLDYYSGRPFVDLSHYFIGNVYNNGFYKAHKVIAWMPLPEPYKAESEVENDSRIKQ